MSKTQLSHSDIVPSKLQRGRPRKFCSGSRPCGNVFPSPKTARNWRDRNWRDRLSIFLRYRVRSQSGHNLKPCWATWTVTRRAQL